MTESQALRWVETLGEGVRLERAHDDDAGFVRWGAVRWFVSHRGRQAWGDTLTEALVRLRASVEAKP